jgi:gliding motility-associated-like protein
MLALGVVKKASGQFRLVRDISYGSAVIETENEYTIPGNVDFNTTCAMDNAGDVMALCLPGDGKMVFLRHFATYQTAPEHTRRYNVPKGSEMMAVARSGADEGFLFGLNNVAANEIILIKTDSIGTLAGCGFEEINNSFNETINRNNIVASVTATGIAPPVAAGIVSLKTTGLTSKTDCNEMYCPVPPIDDTCLSSYFKLFRSNSYVQGFGSYHLMRNNIHLLATARGERIFADDNQQTFSIRLLNERGDFIKGVHFFLDSVNIAAGIKQIDDQHIMILSYAQKDGKVGFAFTYMNDNLDILWTKAIQAVGYYPYNSGGSGVGDFVADKEGNFYFVANSIGFYERPKVLVHKMDNNGNSLWTKSYEMEQGQFLTSSATTTASSLIVVMEGNSLGSVSARLDKKTGEMLNAFIYNNSHDGSVYNRTLQSSNDHIFYAGNNAASRFVMGSFDTTGRPIKFKSFNHDGSIVRAAAVKDGKLYAKYQYFNGSTFKDVLLKADTALSLDYINEFDFIRYGLPVGIGVSSDGSVYEGANYFYGGINGTYVDGVLKKFDTNGGMGTCNFIKSTPVITDIDLKTLSQTFDPVAYSFIPIDVSATVIPEMNAMNVSEILCSSKQTCNFIDVTGKNIICDFTKTYTYRSVKNAGCNLQPTWVYDTALATIKNVSDSAAGFIFKKPGSVWLKAILNAGCKIYSDSILVQIQNTQSSFSLGKDTSLCTGDSLLLKAGAGYNNYLWQDGSAGATFTVKKAGIYFVSVSNLCGDKYSDTIETKAAIVPALNIGNDISVCLFDTVQITASTGFKTYTWQSTETLLVQANKAVIVVLKNETITLQAITADGCPASDTLKLTGIKAKQFSLGNDTSFCAGESITLLTSGYNKYQWSTGSTANSIAANQTGKYWLHALDNNGCYAKDTIEIKNVYPLPVINLGSDFDLCIGQTRRLDAGAFTKYLWQDGSANRYYNTVAPSLIWVRATNENGCIASDSVAFKSVLPVPGNFLQPTDSICQYEQLTLTPLSAFNAYKWSTGSTNPSLVVDAGGTYVLTVMDASGCTGNDTTIVFQKNCYSGVHVPTAFTPNGDALNDVFRARVYGTVISFRLQVYNRFGELVFSTTNPMQAWNGAVRGRPESSGVFVFHCSYELAGGRPSTLQGTVTLIR